LEEYIPTALNFYSFLTDEDLRYIEDKIVAKKDAHEILSIYTINIIRKNEIMYHIQKA